MGIASKRLLGIIFLLISSSSSAEVLNLGDKQPLLIMQLNSQFVSVDFAVESFLEIIEKKKLYFNNEN